MFNFQNKENKNIIFYFFFLILSLNYIVPYVLFGKITLFYNDSLDHEIVYNSIIGKFYSGDTSSINLFLNGEIKIEFLRRLFHPASIFYVIFNLELAYWLIDIMVKLTSFISVYVLAKKINRNYFISALMASTYASINLPTLEHFGNAILPYIFYLIVYRKNLILKHYLIVVLFGLNSSFVMTFLSSSALILVIIAYAEKNSETLKKILKIFPLFFLAILLANSNLIYTNLSGEVFHRTEFVRSPLGILQFISNIFYLPDFKNWNSLYLLPYTIIVVPLIIFSIFKIKEKSILNLIVLFVFFQSIVFFTTSSFFLDFINNSNTVFKEFTWSRVKGIFPFFYVLLGIHLFKLKIKFKKFLIFCLILSLIVSQINTSVVPFTKKFILKISNYKNIYTFDGYYNYDEYAKIKDIVNDKRVLSIGLDPMVAVMNGIGVIDGYHNLYPLHYKKKFRKIIENELKHNEYRRKYYDNWGSRLYAEVSDEKNIKINFREAKKIGAYYAISKYPIKSKELSLKLSNLNQNIYLYEIN